MRRKFNLLMGGTTLPDFFALFVAPCKLPLQRTNRGRSVTPRDQHTLVGDALKSPPSSASSSLSSSLWSSWTARPLAARLACFDHLNCSRDWMNSTRSRGVPNRAGKSSMISSARPYPRSTIARFMLSVEYGHLWCLLSL